MALETLEFDAADSGPNGEDPGTPLVIQSASANYLVTAASFPAPTPKLLWATSIDTDGGTRADPNSYENRTITLTIEALDSSSSSTHQDALAAKFTKIAREGATLKRTRKDSAVRIYDLLAGDSFDPVTDIKYENGRAEFTVALTAKPFSRGAEQDLGDNTETTLPALIFTEASIPGEVDALGRLVIDEDDADDQFWVTYGIEQDALYTFTDSTGSGALFYQAESRTAMGGSATAVGPAGASGAGSNVMRNTALATSYQAILSTQASGGGAHLTHVGAFRVYARVQVSTSNVGSVSLALQWSHGDFRFPATNTATVMDEAVWVSSASWRLVDLGLVSIPSTAVQWEGRIIAKSSTAGDDIDIDYLMLIPADWASGTVTASTPLEVPTAFVARDEFDQSAGALTGKVLPVGGTWAGAGDADDFTVNATTDQAERTTNSDAITSIVSGRVAIAGSTNYTNIAVGVSGTYTAAVGAFTGTGWGVLARYTDTSNYLAAYVVIGPDSPPLSSYVTLAKRVAGTGVILGTWGVTSGTLHPMGTTKDLRMQVDDQGRVFVWFGDVTTPQIAVQHADLATGGTLATGKIAFVDNTQSSDASTRSYDDFVAWVPTKDAAVFASQSLEIRHDRARRENSVGAYWVDKTVVGDYLKLPPAGAEGRNLRVIAKACRNDPTVMPDSGIDDISAKLFATGRYLT